MAIKPILFNTEMVRAIQEGRKTETRRLVQGEEVLSVLSSPCRKAYPDIPDHRFIETLCNARYEKGDILWVRETWSFWPCFDCDNEMCYGRGINYKGTDGCFVYKT